MLKKLLFPNKYKTIGWCILLPSTILGVILIVSDFDVLAINTKVFSLINDEIFGQSHYFTIINTNVTNTLVGILFIIGALLVGFSSEKREDEFIEKLRMTSLLWAVFVNYILLLVSFLFIYGTAFLNVMLYNMFTVLIIFIARFNYILYQNRKSVDYEEHH